jgi:uncharacterized damage-inducible protein DinB
MKRFLAVIGLCSAACLAQDAITKDALGMWTMASGYVKASAEKIPENLYSFKATPEVRSVAQLIGHIANANYAICSGASGMKSDKKGGNLEMLTAKADLLKALDESVAFCNAAAGSLTAANSMETAKVFGMEKTRLGWFFFNAGHNWEHYGNLVTYMRLNKIIPPSSEPKK